MYFQPLPPGTPLLGADLTVLQYFNNHPRKDVHSMVKHIILFTLKDDADKPAVIAAAQAALLPLVGQIPGLTKMEVKPCFCGPDFVLYSEFDSREALNGYADHPLHVEAKSHFFPWVASRMPGDYEV